MVEKDIKTQVAEIKDKPIEHSALMQTENDMRALLQALINTIESVQARLSALEKSKV